MTGPGQQEAAPQPGGLGDLPAMRERLPIDLLHVSDLHFRRRRDLDREERWQSLLRHVAECRTGGRFDPQAIAFTGDLVESPGPFAGRSFRRGVNALLELAARCGFLGEDAAAPVWGPEEPSPPTAWWSLLDRRIFLVPGNHDLYCKGLRVLWNRFTSGWRRIAGPPEAPVRVVPRFRAVTAGPLAVLLLDSNGPRALAGMARGEVERQTELSWPADLGVGEHHFRLALVHGHPVQLPFVLANLDQEAFMAMENAGLLLKNLANLDVRLVLHGHRHYPGVSTLAMPDSQWRTRRLVVAAAGSVTRPPGGWPYCACDWVRIFPDHRIEVTLATLQPGVNQFSIGAEQPFLAESGDFHYEAICKRIEVKGPSGDTEETVTVSGFRVAPGRPPVGSLPFAKLLAPRTTLAAIRCRVLTGGPEGAEVAWNEAGGAIEIRPPQRDDLPPMNLELTLYLHNALALDEWEGHQMYGAQGQADLEWTSLTMSCETGRLELAAAFLTAPEEPVVEVSRRGHAEGEASTVLTKALVSEEAGRRLAVACERPRSTFRYALRWRLPRSPAPPESMRTELWAIHVGQRRLLDEYRLDRRPLDDLCRGLAPALAELGLGGEAEVGLFIGETTNLRRVPPMDRLPIEPAALRLVGANLELAPPLSRWSLPFGCGVGGRAFRIGRPVFHHVSRAEASRADFEAGRGGAPENFYFRQGDEPTYVALVAVPIFPTALGASFEVEVRSPPFTLAVLCVGTRSLSSPMAGWSGLEVDALVARIAPDLEAGLYARIRAMTGGGHAAGGRPAPAAAEPPPEGPPAR